MIASLPARATASIAAARAFASRDGLSCPLPAAARSFCAVLRSAAASSARLGGGATSGARVALPVRAHGRDLGHFVITLPTAGALMSATTDDRHAAVALADQLGMALLRYERPD